MVVIEPNRKTCSVGRALPGQAGHEDSAGQAAVEQQGQGDVAVGVPAFADHLDQDGSQHRDHGGRPERRGVGEQAEGDAGDGDVADPVAHQGQASLHQVGADRRGGEAGEQGGQQRPLHELEGEQLHVSAPVQR